MNPVHSAVWSRPLAAQSAADLNDANASENHEIVDQNDANASQDDVAEKRRAKFVGGSWRQIALAKRLGIPAALGMTTDEWVQKRLGGYVKMSIPERKEAVAKLTAEGVSGNDAAEILGVDPRTIDRDKVVATNVAADVLDDITEKRRAKEAVREPMNSCPFRTRLSHIASHCSSTSIWVSLSCDSNSAARRRVSGSPAFAALMAAAACRVCSTASASASVRLRAGSIGAVISTTPVHPASIRLGERISPLHRLHQEQHRALCRL